MGNQVIHFTEMAKKKLPLRLFSYFPLSLLPPFWHFNQLISLSSMIIVLFCLTVTCRGTEAIIWRCASNENVDVLLYAGPFF